MSEKALDPGELNSILEQLKRAAEQKKARMASRPTRDEVAEALEYFTQILDLCLQREANGGRQQAVIADEKVIEVLSDNAWWPAKGSPVHRQRDELTTLGWQISFQRDYDTNPDFDRVVSRLHSLSDAVIEHSYAICAVLRDERTKRAPLALGRILIDAAAHLCWIADPKIDARERLIRALNDELHILGEEHRSATRDGDSEIAAEREAEIVNILQSATSRGESVKWNKGRGLPNIGASTSTRDMIDAILGDGEPTSIWSELSKVVHSQMDRGFELMLELGGSDDVIPVYLVAAAFSIATVRERLHKIHGWDLERVTAPENIALKTIAAAAGIET